jgi:hypothetical protein
MSVTVTVAFSTLVLARRQPAYLQSLDVCEKVGVIRFVVVRIVV